MLRVSGRLAITWLWLLLEYGEATSSKRPPIRSISHLQDASYYSHDGTLKHDSKLELSFTTSNGPIQLELAPNWDLLHHESATFIREDDMGGISAVEAIVPTQYNVYKGSTMRSDGLYTQRIGTARILVHSANPLLFEGTFLANDRMHTIQLARDYARMKSDLDADLSEKYYGEGMVLWSDADLDHQLAKRGEDESWYVEPGHFCSADDLLIAPRMTGTPSELVRRQLSGDTGSSYVTQDQLARTIGSTNGCPKQREVAILGAAADCNFVQLFNSTSSARASIIAAFNSASAVYESSFNVSLGLGQIVISEATCPSAASSASPWNTACSDSISIGDRLNEFSSWRGNQHDSFAAWSLITTCATGSEIGVAWLGTLCNANTTNQTTSTVSGTNVVAASTSGGTYWRTLAHELGHNFGANHDCTTSLCGTSTPCCPLSASTCPANGQYLMNPAASSGASSFSPCTIGQVCTNFLNKRITTSCLSTNQNVQLADGAASCGNGIVEQGEDCDCGGVAGCSNNPCCNPTTCKFVSGAVCDSEISSCCTSQCQYAPANTTCRASTGLCDPAETCSGTSGSCPTDAFAPNGQDCGSGSQCASGQCTSRLLQCQQQMNGSRAPCDDYQCALTCYIGSQCFIANQYFISGTPCGNGGFCQTGICDQGSVGHQIGSWFDSNKKWLIPVIAAVGGIIVLIVLYCWVSSCIASRKKKRPEPQMVYSSQQYGEPTQYSRQTQPWDQAQPLPWNQQQQQPIWHSQQYPSPAYHQYPQPTYR